MGEIYNWVKDIIIFLVLTTIISNLLGKSNYKKYVNLVAGIILVILVISPLLKLFQLGDTLDYYFSVNTFSTEAKDLNGKLLDMEKGQMSAILQEYKEGIKGQVIKILENQELYLIDIQIMIEEDLDSDAFGNLKALDIHASYIRQDIVNKSSKIEKVEIDSIEIGSQIKTASNADRDTLSPSEINVKNLLSDFYNMNPDNINISIQEQ